MDAAALAIELKEMNVTPVDEKDPNRPVLYLAHLRKARTFLHEEIREILGQECHDFCRPALTDGLLLNDLAKVLDFYAGSALDNRLDNWPSPGFRPRKLADFYDQYIWPPIVGDDTYLRNVERFLVGYPAACYAIEKVTSHFQQNVQTVCKRVHQDRCAIMKVFWNELPELELLTLTSIRFTGADQHKGGQQVLILGFDSLSGGVPKPLRLVYKPSDVEIDCILVGDSAAVNRARPNYLATGSLFEIFNSLADAIPLATHKVLPRVCLRDAPPSEEPPFSKLRELYGYVEYLSHEEPHGSGEPNDFMLFGTQAEKNRAKWDFYHTIGRLLALSCTFSLTDMHAENVRVSRCRPHLIDLEVSLGPGVVNVLETGMFEGLGGIEGYETSGINFQWVLKKGSDPESLTYDYLREKFANRLSFGGADQPVLVPVEPSAVLDGLEAGLKTLAANIDSFEDWFKRTSGVLVRVLPASTGDLKGYLKDVCINRPEGVPERSAPSAAQALYKKFLGNFHSNEGEALPEFAALAPGHVEQDFFDLDIPSFYRRIDQCDIVDSRGNKVDVPRDLAGRGTYYPETPASPVERLRAGLWDLADRNVLASRTKTLQGQIAERLGVKAPATGRCPFGKSAT